MKAVMPPPVDLNCRCTAEPVLQMDTKGIISVQEPHLKRTRFTKPLQLQSTRVRPYRAGHSLTDEGQELRALFLMNTGGCTCFRCAPCAACTHPGNTLTLEENDDVWRPLTEQEIRFARVKRKLDLDV